MCRRFAHCLCRAQADPQPRLARAHSGVASTKEREGGRAAVNSNFQSTIMHKSHATRHLPHVTSDAPHILHVTRHTSHVTRHTSHVTRHTSHVIDETSHVTCHTSHVTCHTSHVTRHTSHVTRHTSHVTRQMPHATCLVGALPPLSAVEAFCPSVNTAPPPHTL